MKIEKGDSYISDRSDLKVFIIDIYEETEEYTKAEVMLLHKKYGFWYGSKKEILYHDRIQHWTRIEE